MDINNKYIHLLYVPTMACNMGCKYCYLENNTKDIKTKHTALETLKYAIEKLKESNVIPFNISLHGGEVTTLNTKDFRELIQYIDNYYKTNKKQLTQAGFKVGSPHIKTNLYDIEKHIQTIKDYKVSISGSLDLPLKLHNEYRVTKDNKKTLEKIFKNIELLNSLPNKKKISATIFKEHFKHLDEIVEDIKYLDHNTSLDMNDFNFMIGFDYNSNGILHGLNQQEQVELFNRMHEEFDNTNLDIGVNGAWFNEFGPEYCTNCDNCGEKFFLLEKNGDIYSCVRGQKQLDFYYGNIYKNTVEEILKTAFEKIYLNHNKQPLNEECLKCGYLYICKTGCPFVKNVYNTNKSYTCKLQQQLYEKRNYEKDKDNRFAYEYIKKMHPEEILKLDIKDEQNYPTLEEIIDSDPLLKYIYDENTFILKVDEQKYHLKSQILRKARQIITIGDKSNIVLYVKDSLLSEQSPYPENNALHIILLSGDMIKYGDEGRYKQKHIMSHQIYKNVLDKNKSDLKGYQKVDISNIIKNYKDYISKDKPNNIFFTTNDLRNYHYTKQKNNAYYHFQAINLPFQNIEFNYLDEEEFHE